MVRWILVIVKMLLWFSVFSVGSIRFLIGVNKIVVFSGMGGWLVVF